MMWSMTSVGATSPWCASMAWQTRGGSPRRRATLAPMMA